MGHHITITRARSRDGYARANHVRERVTGRWRRVPGRRRSMLVGPLVASFLLALVSAAAAASPYPDEVPDFAHADDPHSALFSPVGGTTDRPMLVLYPEFSDLTYDDTSPPGIDAADMANRFFGGFPSVADYFADDSNGELVLTPAAETDASNNGAADDGVVSVTIDQTKDDFINWEDPDWAQQNADLLEAADPHVDFSSFDRDGDGRITEVELVVVRVDVDPGAIPQGSGATRDAAAVELDGVELGGLSVAQNGTATNLITIIHEVGHALFAMPDLYFWNVGRFDLAGGTSNLQEHELFRTSAWQKLHLGWTTPTVVTESGYYDVPRSPAGSSFILYDPAQGTNDYFIVENRAPTNGTYDQGVDDTGLIIWRLEDDAYTPDGAGEAELGPEGGFITMIRPDHGQAWDPSHPSKTQRTMVSDWRDGTPADVAVRAIPAAGDTMRVYFDVRGPGILVDPHSPQGRPLRMDVTPGEVNTLSVPVRNTGEASDTFRFDYEDLPAAWSTEPDVQDLDAGEDSVAQAGLVPAADAPVGLHEVTIVGRSETDSSVTERATFWVDVVLDDTEITYTGQTYGPIGEPAGFRAQVTNPDDGDAPVDGVEVTFQLSGLGGTQTATATTGADGVASADPLVDLPPGDYHLTASTPRFGKHAPAGTSTAYRVPTAAERVQDLRDEVAGADLPRGTQQRLTATLDTTLEHLEAERTHGACNTLQAFVNQVRAQRGKEIPLGTADALSGDAEGIRAQLDCDS